MVISEQKPEHSSLRTLREVCNYLINMYKSYNFIPPKNIILPLKFTAFGEILMEKNIIGLSQEQDMFVQALQTDPSYEVVKYVISNPISTIRFVFNDYKFCISIERDTQYFQANLSIKIEGKYAENIPYSDII